MTSNNKDWDKLPYEIICSIFAHVQDGRLETLQGHATQKYASNTRDLLQCQLVCKGWLRAAQKIIYEQIHLGRNLQRFAETITFNNPHLATLVKRVSFGSNISSTDDCSSYIASVVNQCIHINHLLVDNSTTEKLVWPWLLLEDMKLKNLEVITNNLYYTNTDPVLYSLLAIKLRKSLKTLKISLLKNQRTAATTNGMQGYDRIIQRLGTFSALENLMITNGNPPSYQTLDQLIDDFQQKLRKLTISKLELHEWRKEAIKANQSITCLQIGSFIIDDFSLSYLTKFKNLNDLTILSLTYKQKEVAEKENHWNELMQLCTSVKAFTISLNYNDLNIKYIVDKCLDILQRMDSHTRRLGISIIESHTPSERHIDYNPPTHDNMRTPSVTISKSKTGSCNIEIEGNTEELRSNILKHLVDWIQLYAPTSVAMNDSLAQTRYHKLLTVSILRPPKLKPYFDFNNKSDIKQFLTRELNGKYWNVLNTLLSSTSTKISANGIVLPNVHHLLAAIRKKRPHKRLSSKIQSFAQQPWLKYQNHCHR